MRVPNLSAGASRGRWRVSTRAGSGADAIFPQLVYCSRCKRDPDNPPTCLRQCCVYKLGQEINCWEEECMCH